MEQKIRKVGSSGSNVDKSKANQPIHRNTVSVPSTTSPTVNKIPIQTICGYLLKQGAHGLKIWKKRWFILDEESCKLFYFENKEDTTKSLGFIDIGNAESIKLISKEKFEFEIRSGIGIGGRNYRLIASSSEELNFWLDQLEKYQEIRKKTQNLSELAKLVQSDDYEVQLESIYQLGGYIKSKPNIEAFNILFKVSAIEDLDPSIYREIVTVLSKSSLESVKKNSPGELVSIMDKSLRIILNFLNSKSTEVLVYSLDSLIRLIAKNVDVVTFLLQTKLIGNIIKVQRKVNKAVQRKAIQLLDSLALIISRDKITLEFVTKSQIKEILTLVKEIEDTIILEFVLSFLINLSTIDNQIPLIGTKGNLRNLNDFLNLKSDNDGIRILLQQLLVNLATNETVRNKIVSISPTLIDFINSALPQEKRYKFSHLKKEWYQPSPLKSSNRPTSQIFIPKPTSADWKESLIEFLNYIINEKIKEEGVSAPKLEFLSIDLPNEISDESSILIKPYFVDNNQVRAEVNVKLQFKAHVSATMKGLSVKSNISNLNTTAKLALGFDSRVLEPTWFAFVEVPSINIKVDVEKIPISLLLKKIVEKVIKELLLLPKKQWIETSMGMFNDSTST